MTTFNSSKQQMCWCGFLAALFALPIVSGALSAKSPGNVQPQPVPVQPIASVDPVVLPQATQPKKVKLISRVASGISGLASWYGEKWHGHKTASGEAFDMDALTACHKTLPFGTRVLVTNLRNHQSVIVRITDRGRLSAGRVIDLSSAAAEKLDMLRSGIAPVRLNILSPDTVAHLGY